MAEPTVEMFTDVDVDDALVVVAFTSTGAAAPIASAYLRRQLDLPLVGHVAVPELGPIVHVQDGVASSPIRIHGGDIVCNLGRECRGLYVISGELPLPMEFVPGIAEAVVAWAKGSALVLCLEAVERAKDDDEPDVFLVGGRGKALERLSATKAEALRGGVLVGMTAGILSAAQETGIDAGALVVEATRGHPDGRAAAALIQALDPLIPDIDVDAGPLMDEAMELEKHIQTAMQDAERAQVRRPQQHTFI